MRRRALRRFRRLGGLLRVLRFVRLLRFVGLLRLLRGGSRSKRLRVSAALHSQEERETAENHRAYRRRQYSYHISFLIESVFQIRRGRRLSLPFRR